MNILCNPTGKKGHFHLIDWVIEHNNLYIKVSLDVAMWWRDVNNISVSEFTEESFRTIPRNVSSRNRR